MAVTHRKSRATRKHPETLRRAAAERPAHRPDVRPAVRAVPLSSRDARARRHALLDVATARAARVADLGERPPAQRSAAAEEKAARHTLADGTPAHSFRTLLEDLSTIVRNAYRVPGASDDAPTFRVVTTPSENQRRALALLEAITA